MNTDITVHGESENEVDFTQMLNDMPIEGVKCIANGWGHYIMAYLGKYGAMRPSQLYSSIRLISFKMLHQNLEVMRKYGFVKKTVIDGKPPMKVEYELTEMGRSYLPTMKYFVQWHVEHYEEMLRSKAAYEKEKIEKNAEKERIKQERSRRKREKEK